MLAGLVLLPFSKSCVSVSDILFRVGVYVSPFVLSFEASVNQRKSLIN